jgi:hypothetical protein
MLTATSSRRASTTAEGAASVASPAPAASGYSPIGNPAMMNMLPPQALARMPAAARQQLVSAFANMGANSPNSAAYYSGMQRQEQLPKVQLQGTAERRVLQPSTTQMAKSSSKGGGTGAGTGSMLQGFASEAMTFAAIGGGGMFAAPAMGIASGLMGHGLPGMGHHASMPTFTYIWALPGRNSSTHLQQSNLKMEVEYGDITGLDPDNYEPVLLRLVQSKDNWRLVGATHERMNSKGQETTSVSDEVRIPIQVTKLGRGHVVFQPSAPLPDGEYGLVLRSMKPQKKAAMNYGATSAADILMYSVWDFSVAGTANAGAAK